MYQEKILIVEDEEELQSVLNTKLSDAGFSITQAFDGEQGLEMAMGNHPDLILLDLIMPKMDGWTMLQKLREDPWGKSVCILVLTNLGNIDDGLKYEDLHIQDYLIKTDWTLDSLVERVRACLRTHT